MSPSISKQRLLRPIVPGAARRRLRQLERSVRIAALARRAGRVEPTPVPLDTRTLDRLDAAFVPRASQPLPRVDAGPFPEEDALLAWWPSVRGVVQALAGHNRPDDKYFQWSRLADRIAHGEELSKDLFVAWLASTHAPSRILEIGGRTGRSLSILAFAHADPRSFSAVVVDPFVEMGSPAVLRRNVDRVGGDGSRVVTLVGRSAELVPALGQARPGLRFDYVLVDGSHEREDARHDLDLIEPLVAPGGYVVFDDIGPETYGLLGVWEDWLAATSDSFVSRIYSRAASFAVARKAAAGA
jgi:hypothetical protein